MSVIVKGMEMPECCGRCDYNVSSLYCKRTRSEIDRDYEYRERLSDCPIFELPDHHGRLVDADAFKACLRNALKQTRNAYSDKGEWAETITEQFCDAIDDQPTIVEAEDGT